MSDTDKTTAITAKGIDKDLWVKARAKGMLLKLNAPDIINQALALWLEQNSD